MFFFFEALIVALKLTFKAEWLNMPMAKLKCNFDSM